MKKYLVIDKFSLSRETLVSLIYEIEKDSIVYEAQTVEEVKELAEFYESIDYLILNSSFSENDTSENLAELTSFKTKARKLVISRSYDMEFIEQLKQTGVDAAISNKSTRNEICSAIRSLRTGESYIDQSIMRSKQSYRRTNGKSQAFRNDNSQQKCWEEALTARQKEVLDYMSKGYANKLIAYELGVSEGTVKLHVSSILRALNVSNRTEAVMRVSHFLQ